MALTLSRRRPEDPVVQLLLAEASAMIGVGLPEADAKRRALFVRAVACAKLAARNAGELAEHIGVRAAAVASQTGARELARTLLAKHELQFGPNAASLDLASAMAMAEGDLIAAEKLASAALSLDPAHKYACIRKSAAQLERGLADAAAGTLRAGLRELPEDPLLLEMLPPVLNYAQHETEAAKRAAAEAYARTLAPGRGGSCSRREKIVGKRLRIGLLSGDWRQHSVAAFTLPLLQHGAQHADFEVFSTVPVALADRMTQRLKDAHEANAWHDLTAAGNPATLIADRKLDVLVELGGLTSTHHARLLCGASAALANWVVTWLGYPATTGMALDGRIVDAITDPPADVVDAAYSEHLVRMGPGEHFVCFDAAPLPDASACRRTWDSANVSVRFASFNTLSKLSPRCIALYAKVLGAIPHSTLMLKAAVLGHASVQADVVARFAAAGIAPERLELFGPDASVQLHLKRYASVDVALDSQPYSGTTTTCEALCMGVPLVTLAEPGAAHVSRVSASLLHAAGRVDLVAGDELEYVQIAARCAMQAQQEQASSDALSRAGRAQAVRQSVLCDGVRFAAAFVRTLERVASGNQH